MICASSGPIPASIMIVGEAPGAAEERLGLPFVGPSGSLLTSLLHEVGLNRASCFVTNVCRHRPPNNDISLWFSDNKKPPEPSWTKLHSLWIDPRIAEGYKQLQHEIAEVRPTLIIALGGTALWALTGKTGIHAWRGSRLTPDGLSATVVPSLHPAAVLRQLELLPILKMDLLRAKRIFEGSQVPRHYQFQVAPSFSEARATLLSLLTQASASPDPFLLAGDIETRAGHIACYGYAWSPTEALCIPILQAGDTSPFYWSDPAEEAEILVLINRLHKHPNILHIGQNYLYDCQYYSRFCAGIPTRVFDTMIAHHSLYSSLRKGLAFLSSMYAQDHVFWKDESKNWDPKVGERQLWTYNCKDACITYEVAQAIWAELGVCCGRGESAGGQKTLEVEYAGAIE